MTSAMIWILAAVVVYLLGMLAIGFKYANNSTSEDFYLGGRKLGPIVTAMSTEASDMSAYLLMGVPGLAFFCGVAEAGWTAIGLALGTYLNWLIVAKPLRRYSLAAGNAIGNIGASMIQQISDVIAQVPAQMVSVGSSFEASMSQVAATMGITSAAEEFDILSDAAKEMGEATKFSASQAGLRP